VDTLHVEGFGGDEGDGSGKGGRRVEGGRGEKFWCKRMARVALAASFAFLDHELVESLT